VAAPATLLLVGCGKMGGALLSGWTQGRAAQQFFVVEPAGLPQSLASVPQIVWHRSPATLSPALAPDAVVFAVKPQTIDEVLADYRCWAEERTLFLSIVAGKTIAGIEKHLGAAAIVRSMPNTPAAIGRAITVACANPRVSEAQRRLCEHLLAAIGESAWVEDESLMDAVTALSGSGPAYVFLLIEALAAAGEKEGLSPALALRLAESTVAGAGELARLSPEPPAELRRNVTSPGGTTQAALAVLTAAGGLPALIERAVAAAARRSRELAL
jgi:pyrroline-5-carboxylate reductase